MRLAPWVSSGLGWITRPAGGGGSRSGVCSLPGRYIRWGSGRPSGRAMRHARRANGCRPRRAGSRDRPWGARCKSGRDCLSKRCTHGGSSREFEERAPRDRAQYRGAPRRRVSRRGGARSLRYPVCRPRQPSPGNNWRRQCNLRAVVRHSPGSEIACRRRGGRTYSGETQHSLPPWRFRADGPHRGR